MYFSLTVCTSFLLCKILALLLGSGYQWSPLGLQQNQNGLPRPYGLSRVSDIDVHSSNLVRSFRGSITLFHLEIGTYLDHYNQYANNQTWHSVSFRDGSTSLLLGRQSCLTGSGITRTSLYKLQIHNNTSGMKLTLTYLCFLLIANAHDTEVNPGPYKPNSRASFVNLPVSGGKEWLCVIIAWVGTMLLTA